MEAARPNASTMEGRRNKTVGMNEDVVRVVQVMMEALMKQYMLKVKKTSRKSGIAVAA